MGRATASVSFRRQIVLVYLQYISAKIHSKCASQPKIAKNSLKTHIFGVQGRSRSSMLVPLESSSAVRVMIRSKSVSICNHSRARLVGGAENDGRGNDGPSKCPGMKLTDMKMQDMFQMSE